MTQMQKNLVVLMVLLAPLTLTLACRSAPSVETSSETLFFNGKIFTADTQNSMAQAVLIDGPTIKFVGKTTEAKQTAHPKARLVDLKGSTVIPGIHDVHVHALESGSDSTHFSLNPEKTDAEEHALVVEQAAEDFPDTEWLVGFGHSLASLLESRRSPRVILDEVAPDRPVIIMEATSHSMWVNSAALELAGIDASTPNPVGGIISRDSLGEPDGVLIDNAGNIVMDLALAGSPERLRKDGKTLEKETLPKFARFGITSFCDARGYWKRNHHKVWLRLWREKKLTARVIVGLWAYPSADDDAQISTLKKLYRNDPGELLRISQIKLYSDGITHNTTAAMKYPYQVDLLGIPGNRGLNYFTQSRIESYIRELEAVGFDFHIHAIGNRGVHESLNAIASASNQKGRHRLTHVEFVNQSDLSRFKKLNVTADCQVAGDYSQPQNWSESAHLVGKNMNSGFIPLQSLKKAGARLNLSSDWNVSTLNPFVGLEHSVTRAPQKLSLVEALRAYTIDAAYTMRQEQLTGSLEVGKKADFIVLDQDIFEIPVERISDTKVKTTIFNGETIWSDQESL